MTPNNQLQMRKQNDISNTKTQWNHDISNTKAQENHNYWSVLSSPTKNHIQCQTTFMSQTRNTEHQTDTQPLNGHHQ